MNPRSYEATLDEFPDLFPAVVKPDNQFATSSYYASYYALKVPLKITKSGFLDINVDKRAVFKCTLGTHSEE